MGVLDLIRDIIKVKTYDHLGFAEFRSKIGSSIDKIRELETDLEDMVTEIGDLGSSKGATPEDWRVVPESIRYFISSYTNPVKHLQKSPIENVSRYKKELQNYLSKATNDFHQAYRNLSDQLIIIRSQSIREFGQYSEEARYTQGTLNFIRSLRRIFENEITTSVNEYLQQPNDFRVRN